MYKNFAVLSVFLFSSLVFMSCGKTDEINLFNGETLEGWEGSETVFRVEERAIVGGNLKEPLEQSLYLCTKQTYENFELKLSAKFIGSDLNINGVTTAKFTEKGHVPSKGCIALQAHAGGPYEIWYKDIRLKQLD